MRCVKGLFDLLFRREDCTASLHRFAIDTISEALAGTITPRNSRAYMLTSLALLPPAPHTAYYEPLVYNARVLGNVLKQVYIAESLAPPKSLKTIVDSYRTIWARASDRAYYGKLLSSGEWKKVAIYGVEAYGIFTIGEMVGSARERRTDALYYGIYADWHSLLPL